MRTKGREQVGVFTPDNLIAGNRHPVDTCHIIIKAGQKLLRGSLLVKDTAEPEKYVIIGTDETGTESGSRAEPEYILVEDADAAEEDMVCLAYRSGEFAENALIVKDGYEITENDRKALRGAGIFLSTIMMEDN